jgi:ATP-dependent DNA helicase RecG
MICINYQTNSTDHVKLGCMSEEQTDWTRLQKALSVEAEKGFTNLQGNQYRFSEFMCLSLGQSPPTKTPFNERRKWQELALKFSQYTEFSESQRKQLVIETRQFLQDLRQTLENPPEPPKPKVSKTIPVTETAKTYRSITLDQPLGTLAAVGYKKGLDLEKLGLKTVKDLLFYYPRDHIDYSRQVDIAYLVPGETVTLLGTVKRCNCFNSPKNPKLAIFEIIISDRTGQLKLNRFYAGTRYTNRGWQEKQKRLYPAGSIIAASGLVKKNKYGVTLENPEFEVLDSSGASIESLKIGRVLPVYPLTEGIAADNIHFPENSELLAHARRRLVFDEFFFLQLGFLQRRHILRQTQTSATFNPRGQLIDRFNDILPFTLTNAQKRVIQDIFRDLNSSTPMNRLVQGDVGSGKTVVAVYAILAAIQSGYQAALMAPTEVLAEQHYRKLVTWFNLLHLPVELLTGSTKQSKRREIHAQLETGELPLLVGTHALIQDPVNFRKLGLVVIDEQHRFGVQQRARCCLKANLPTS